MHRYTIASLHTGALGVQPGMGIMAMMASTQPSMAGVGMAPPPPSSVPLPTSSGDPEAPPAIDNNQLQTAQNGMSHSVRNSTAFFKTELTF